MTDIKARPTLYKGIQMRSRLEADFAAALDGRGNDWKYEPTCFAGDGTQWLPDFQVNEAEYIELKPAYLLESQEGEGMQATIDRLDAYLRQMSVAWLSKPDAWLELVFWTYGGPEVLSVLGHPTRPWVTFNSGLPVFPLIWPGMGQLDAVMPPKPRRDAS